MEWLAEHCGLIVYNQWGEFPAMEMIDTHVHFWDLRRGEVSYPWLAPGTRHPVLGEIDQIKSPLYDAESFIAESRHAHVTKVVHVEADARSSKPRAETDWVEDMARVSGFPTAIVAHVNLAAPDASDRLAAERNCKLVRGIRDFGMTPYLVDPASRPRFEDGVRALEASGLLLDLDCAWPEMAAARKFAARHPSLTIVLEHFGYPRRRDTEYFSSWRTGIHELALAPNVSCKLSGLGMTDRRWTIESLRPWIETCIESFGAARCMYGSNWPVDRIASSYDAMVAAFHELIAGCNNEEREAICSGNAKRIYGI